MIALANPNLFNAFEMGTGGGFGDLVLGSRLHKNPAGIPVPGAHFQLLIFHHDV